MKTSTCLFSVLLLCNAAFAQPLFQVPQPTCAEVQAEMLAPNVFSTYLWDFGNGVTANSYLPPAVDYGTTGNQTISLTVTSTTPFRIVESVQVTQYHPNSWDDNDIFCDDFRPDMYLVFTNASNAKARSYEIEDAPLPSTFLLDGILTQAAFPVKGWDRDGFWCGASDFLGGITVPANSTGGTFSDAPNQLTLQVNTKMVTSATWTQTFAINDTLPAKPVIGCTNDILVSSYPNANQWLYGNLAPIAGATAQTFTPPVEGTYYVKHTQGACAAISEPVHFVPGQCIVLSAASPNEANARLKIYPNPTDGPVRVQLASGASETVKACDLVSMQGRVVAAPAYTRQGDGSLNIDLSPYPSGVWVLRLTTESGVYAQKVVLTKAD